MQSQGEGQRRIETIQTLMETRKRGYMTPWLRLGLRRLFLKLLVLMRGCQWCLDEEGCLETKGDV